MKEFENIVIGGSAIPSLAVTVILMAAIPVVFFVYWRRKHKDRTKISWLIAGAAGFIVSARMLELGVHYFCIMADNPVSRFITRMTPGMPILALYSGGIRRTIHCSLRRE